MLKKDFIKFISDDLTASGSIPVSLNDNEIERIIDKELAWLYQEWNQAFMETWCIMDPSAFNTIEFKNSRIVQLPKCVLGIKEFREINDGGRLFGLADPLLSIDRVAAADFYLSPWSASDTLVHRSIQYSYWDLLRSYTLTHVSYTFNPNTHQLVVTGRTPKRPVIIRAFTKIPEENMYEDALVQRWIIAKCKVSMASILGTFTVNLIGGISINADMWRSEGTEELSELKEKIKGDNACNWFMTVN
jgi:hypothetical protein